MPYQLPYDAFSLPSGAQTPWDPLVIPSSNYSLPAYNGPTASSVPSGVSGEAMPFPLAAMLAISAGTSLFSALAGKSASDRAAKQRQEEALLMAKLEESKLDPFRASQSQARLMSTLDKSLGTTPSTVTPPTGAPFSYSQYTPGNYKPSPELMQWFAELQRRVAAGQGQNTPVATDTSLGLYVGQMTPQQRYDELMRRKAAAAGQASGQTTPTGVQNLTQPPLPLR